MGNVNPGGTKDDSNKRKRSPKVQALYGRKRMKRHKGPDVAQRLPTITPITQCKLRLLKFEHIKDHLLLEEEFLKNIQTKGEERVEEELNAKNTLLDKMRGHPMRVGKMEEMIDDDHAIVSSLVGDTYLPILSFVDRNAIEPGCSVLLTHQITAVVGVLPDDIDPTLTRLKMDKAPTETYADLGGLETQIEEIKEAMEVPLLRPELYEDMGIKPPKGVILYGPPGTGKTLLVKAVANATSATFLRVVGSELVKKHLGEGPKLVRDIFKIAEDNAPTIIFIDEIDAIGSKRFDSSSVGQNEVQRTMIELLTQMDGFDSHPEVKIILATNRIDSLDPALIRPGRIDRKIEFTLPDEQTLKKIFRIHTEKMTLADDVNPDDIISGSEGLSGADIKAMCTEAGLRALRDRRTQVTAQDFGKSKENVVYQKTEKVPESLYT